MVLNNLDNRKEIFLGNSVYAQQNCNCVGCGVCTACVIFAPIVGIILAAAVGLSVSVNKS